LKNNPLHSSTSEVPKPAANHQSVEWVFQNVMEYLDVGIIVLDLLENKVVYQNAGAIALLQEEMDPQDCRAICQLLLPQNLGHPQIEGLEGQQTVRLGNHILGYSVYAITERTCFVLLRDITEKMRLMSIAEAVNTMDNIGYIFSGIRHEIGNPINSIKMTMSVLRRNLGTFSTEVIHEYIDRSMGEIGRVEYLLKSLKNFSMFESPEIKSFDLCDFLDKLVQLAQSGMEKEGIRLQVDMPAGPIRVSVDARALQQVMLNLLANATAALIGRPEPWVEIILQARPEFVWVKIRDNGCGISREDQQHLFKPFYTTKPSGTGLGLVITRKLLAQMSCSIEIASYEGLGTTVGISLPWAEENHDGR
jgi:signal transduction histidine kinase